MTFGLPQRLLAAGALCLVALIALVVVEGRARAAGHEVIVAMEPIDPRSILSGHYVMMGFSETLPEGDVCPATSGNAGKDGWIALAQRNNHHVVAASAPTRAEVEGKGDVLVGGWATCDEPAPAAAPNASSPDGAPARPGRTTMHIGVERFHTDQAQAEAIERAIRDRSASEARVAAILSIDENGTPRTKGLIVDDRRIELTWF